jgi:uncharacterized protein YoaH (UPF0181 family)
MSELLEALERAKIDYDFGALADLLRSGYQPDNDEWDAFAAFTIDHKRRATRQLVVKRARAALRYKELRADKWSAGDAIEKVAGEFDLHHLTVRTVARGRDAAVNRVLDEWAAQTAYKKSRTA